MSSAISGSIGDFILSWVYERVELSLKLIMTDFSQYVVKT